LLLFFLVREPFRTNRIPIPFSVTEALLKQATDWIMYNGYTGKKIFYYDPTACFFLDINPFDEKRARERVSDSEHPESGIAEGEIVLWDAHFSANEGGLPIEKMKGNSYFTLLKTFEPAESFQVLGGNPYSVCIFRRNDKIKF